MTRQPGCPASIRALARTAALAVLLGVAVAVPAAGPGASPAENYEQALRAFETGDIPQSVNALKLAL